MLLTGLFFLQNARNPFHLEFSILLLLKPNIIMLYGSTTL